MSEYYRIAPWDDPQVETAARFNRLPDSWHGQPFVDPPAMPGWAYNSYNPMADKACHESYRPEVEQVKPLLLRELVLAEAPFTGKATACVLRTWSPDDGARRLYQGHTEERAIGRLTTAVATACSQIQSPGEKLDGIYLMGKGLRKPKHAMPSPHDYDALSERFPEEWGPTIIIVSPDSDDYTSVWASAHAPAYSVKEPSDFRDFLKADDMEPDLISAAIAEVTGLDCEDSRYMADMMWAGIHTGLEIYLVGSASGRGEISSALKPQREAYSDIDLLIVVPPDMVLGVAEAAMETLAVAHYGPMRRETMVAHDWSTGREVPGIFLFGAQGKKLQMHIGHSMGEINFRPSNLKRNFYHRVS